MQGLIATGGQVLRVDPATGSVAESAGLDGRFPSCVATDPFVAGRAWCGLVRGGLLRTEDGGRTWQSGGLQDLDITAVVASPAARDVLWTGTEPSALWHSTDGGSTWNEARGLSDLPSSTEWAFPPKPETHHVRWIACHPTDAGRLWLAIEAGALITTPDGGRTWQDRVPGGPYDTHELAIHPQAPDTLNAAAGDGFFRSVDGGATWRSPLGGLEVGYLRSVAIDPGDPDVMLVSGASRPRSAYVAGRSDGRLYRRKGQGQWARVTAGWPDPPRTIAPLLAAGETAGELWAADERGVHKSVDAGRTWEQVAKFAETPTNLRGLALQADA